MKTTFFVITGFLFSGIAAAQTTTVKIAANQSTAVQDNSVHTGTATSVNAKMEKVDASATTSSAVMAHGGQENNVIANGGSQTAVTAEKTAKKADIAADGVVNTTSDVASKTTAGLEKAGHSAEAGVKTTGKMVSSGAVKTTTTLSSAIRTMPVRTSARLGANIGVGLIK